MEILSIALVIIFTIYFLNSTNKKNDDIKKSTLTKINDTNWIVNGKIISFDEDTPMLRMQQEQEDDRHYRYYEINRLCEDCKQELETYVKTKYAIRDNPWLLDCITLEGLESITENYENHVRKCKKLNVHILTKQEYLVLQTHPAYCWRLYLSINSYILGTYTIYNEKSARYIDGSTRRMRKEFEIKNYK